MRFKLTGAEKKKKSLNLSGRKSYERSREVMARSRLQFSRPTPPVEMNELFRYGHIEHVVDFPSSVSRKQCVPPLLYPRAESRIARGRPIAPVLDRSHVSITDDGTWSCGSRHRDTMAIGFGSASAALKATRVSGRHVEARTDGRVRAKPFASHLRSVCEPGQSSYRTTRRSDKMTR